tara:strand:- start:1101 stop:3074 length:1974 start_codon:yes stop_codon:yes gene_type:complete
MADDELEKIVESFKEIDRFLIKGASDMRTLQASISTTNAILESKGWEIFSRFISGTGLWRIQNRVKASIQLINSAMSAEDRRRAKEAKRLKVLADIGRMELNAQKLGEDTAKILAASGADQDKLVEALKEKSDTFSALMVDNNDNAVKAVAALNKMMKEQLIRVDKLKNAQGGLLATLIKQSATYKIIQGFQNVADDTRNFRFGKRKSTKEIEALKAEIEQMKDAADFNVETIDDRGKTKMGATNIRAEMKDTGKTKQLSKKQLDVLEEINNKLAELNDIEEKQPSVVRGFFSVLKAPFANIVTLVKRISKGIAKIVSFFLKLMTTFFVLLLSIMLLRKIFTEFKDDFITAFDAMKEVFMIGFTLIHSGLGDVFTGVKGMITAFTTMDFMGIAESFGIILLGIAKIAVGLFTATLGVIISGAVAFMSSLFSKGFATADTALGKVIAGIANVLSGVTRITGTIVLIAGLIGLVTVGLTALPVLLAGVFILGLSKLFGGLRDNADKAADFLLSISHTLSTIVFFMTLIKDKIPSLSDIASAIKGVLKPEKFDKAGKALGKAAKSISDMLGFSQGGVVPRTGVHMVGERGPELVRLPQGSRVFKNSDTRSMMGGGVTNNITVQVSGRVGASDAEIRDIANKVAREINTRINRTSTSVVKF